MVSGWVQMAKWRPKGEDWKRRVPQSAAECPRMRDNRAVGRVRSRTMSYNGRRKLLRRPPMLHPSAPLEFRRPLLLHRAAPLELRRPLLLCQRAPMEYQEPPLLHRSAPLPHRRAPLLFTQPPMPHRAAPSERPKTALCRCLRREGCRGGTRSLPASADHQRERSLIAARSRPRVTSHSDRSAHPDVS